jgi:hypothetical protein
VLPYNVLQNAVLQKGRLLTVSYCWSGLGNGAIGEPSSFTATRRRGADGVSVEGDDDDGAG